MSVYDYLKALPQDLFGTALLGLMGFPIDPERESWIHEWLNKPYEEVFPEHNPSSMADNLTSPLGHMTALLGKAAKKLPYDKQEQLRNALKDYCEVCDYVNNKLVQEVDMEELIKTMLEYAEWAEANIWEVPITLPDTLREAAEQIKSLTADREELRSELCLRCGTGACNGCKFETKK